MTETPADRPAHSLLVRTTVALGTALVLAFAALLLILRPYLASAFELESTELLQEHKTRARDAARRTDQMTELVLGASLAHEREAAEADLRDAPLELVTDDADAVRALLAAQQARRAADSDANLAALAAETRLRTQEHLSAEWRDVTSRTALRARSFGADLAWRAAGVLLALLATVFLVHGVLLWRSVLAPVRRLADATRLVGEGRLGTRIPVKGDDEVARLAASFNAMTESLEIALEDLRRLNATLEDRVREKIAELQAKERELRQAEKMASLGTLAGGIAHEFNNLLGGIQGCAEDASRETEPEELRETLAVIERTARRGAAITENLLRFARPSEGRREEVDLAEVARDVATLIESEAARIGVDVALDLPGSTPATADPSGMHQVLLNLATNALHAMSEAGGTLTIRVQRDAAAARLVVSDTGVGIAPEDRERLFEPFFTTKAEGTGLGLSVTYAIVTSHRGRIDVESEPGRGATFTVTLPVDPSTGAGGPA